MTLVISHASMQFCWVAQAQALSLVLCGHTQNLMTYLELCPHSELASSSVVWRDLWALTSALQRLSTTSAALQSQAACTCDLACAIHITSI